MARESLVEIDEERLKMEFLNYKYLFFLRNWEGDPTSPFAEFLFANKISGIGGAPLPP